MCGSICSVVIGILLCVPVGFIAHSKNRLVVGYVIWFLVAFFGMSVACLVGACFMVAEMWPDDEGAFWFALIGGTAAGYVLGAALGYAPVLIVRRLPKRRRVAEYDGYDDYVYDDSDRPDRRHNDY